MPAFDNIHSKGARPSEDEKIGKPYKAPEYIAYIRKVMREKYPDTVPRAWMIDSIVKAYMSWFEESLFNGNSIQMYGYGRIVAECKISRHTKKHQWYLKMHPSRHLLLRLREHKGTLTEAEKREVANKPIYAQTRQAMRDKAAAEKRGDAPILDNNKAKMQKDLADLLEKNDGALPDNFNLDAFYAEYS